MDGLGRGVKPDLVVFVDIEDVLTGDASLEFSAFIYGAAFFADVEVQSVFACPNHDFLADLESDLIDGFVIAGILFGGEVDGFPVDIED